MSENRLPDTLDVIPAARSNKFNSVTTVGNKCVDALAKVADKDATTIVEAIRKHVPEVLQMALEVVLEKSRIWTAIDREDDLAYFRALDYDSWVNPGDLNQSELNQAKVMERISAKNKTENVKRLKFRLKVPYHLFWITPNIS